MQKIYQALTNQDIDFDFEQDDDNRSIKKQWRDALSQYEELSKEELFKFLITTEDGQKISDEIMGSVSKIFRTEIPKFFKKQQYKDSLCGIFHDLINDIIESCYREYGVKCEKLQDEKKTAMDALEFCATPLSATEKAERVAKINKEFNLNMSRLTKRYFNENGNGDFLKFDEQVKYMSDLRAIIGDTKIWYFLRALLMNCWYDIVSEKNGTQVPHELLYQDFQTFSCERIKRIIENECEKMVEIVKLDEISDAKQNRNKKGIKDGKDRMDQRVQ